MIAIDDFGIESSNMSRLADLNPDFLKIDGSFIKDVDTNEKHLYIIKSIIQIAKDLNIKTVAEYIHNEVIFDIVQKLGVDYVQGYYLGEPRPEI